jgi:hypothetical protein
MGRARTGVLYSTSFVEITLILMKPLTIDEIARRRR